MNFHSFLFLIICSDSKSSGNVKHILLSGLSLNLLYVLGIGNLYGQEVLKLEKVRSNFFSTQFNLHAGYIHDEEGNRFGTTTRGQRNLVAFQFFHKQKRDVTTDPTKLIRFNSLMFRVATPTSLDFTKENNGINFKVRLIKAWAKFSTKWVNTTIWVGNKTLPYGHSHFLDTASSFMLHSINIDMGFIQDLGVFVKTPISNKIDAQFSIGTGGLFSTALLEIEGNDYSYNSFKRDKRWLVVAHFDNRHFLNDKIGVNLVSGRIKDKLVNDDFIQINRIGVYWKHKDKNKLKVINQVFVGSSKSCEYGSFMSLNTQSSLGYYLKDDFSIDTSFVSSYLTSTSSNQYYLNYTSGMSFTYMIEPLKRLKLNSYYTNIYDLNERNWGVLLQLTMEFGNKPKF
ncbi:hypothetical protein SAMN05421766_101965 [Zobellia uliginosa]|uniref:Phosphate-selective porin O and P n=1 Tax=Zobellia uliginosa TaxID=143224 RepID=A0ABY1KKC4_9FLAO|nr:hypothetical protein [Zobellia uliginosa]SIS43371.1 hypothetical protein SAMN05421766_101965 [Zobellia uliginosa]